MYSGFQSIILNLEAHSVTPISQTRKTETRVMKIAPGGTVSKWWAQNSNPDLADAKGTKLLFLTHHGRSLHT